MDEPTKNPQQDITETVESAEAPEAVEPAKAPEDVAAAAAAEAQEPQDAPEPQEDQIEKIKETTEKLWGSTVHAFSTATFRANQYKKLVQKKIDLSALHKKIAATHSSLGKLIDDLREEGKKSIMSQGVVKDMLDGLDTLKAEAAALEEEIERLRTDEPPQDGDPEQAAKD